MNFEIFKNYISAAQRYDNFDLFISAFKPEQADDMEILSEIYAISSLSLRQLRERYNLSRPALSKLLNIPLRTIENWESNTRDHHDIAPYLFLLIKYALLFTFK